MIWVVDAFLLFLVLITTDWEGIRARLQAKIDKLEEEEEKRK